MTPANLDAELYLDALKELLRERGVTYAEVASSLGCSLPTIKRALNSSSLPFDRLLQIADVAHVSFKEIHDRAERRRPRHFVFTDEQDVLFSERRDVLAYFLELAVHGKTPNEIESDNDLDPRSTELFLGHLAWVGLIDVTDGTEVSLRVEGPFGFGPGSRYLRMEHERFLKAITADVLRADAEDPDSAIIFKTLTLIEGDYLAMLAELEALFSRFAVVSDRSAGDGTARTWKAAFASGPSSEPAQAAISRIFE